MKPLKVYLRIPGNSDCGVGYYRSWLPLIEAQTQGLIELRCHYFTWGEQQGEGNQIPLSEQEFTQNALWSDIVVFSRNDTPDYLAFMLYTKDELKKPVVVDYDDLVQHTRPHNPGYRSFHPNSPHMKFNTQALMYIDGLCVSTKFLQDWYVAEKKKINNSEYDLNYPIFIYPNSLNWEERDKELAKGIEGKYPKKDGEIRIIWSGSASHYENIKQALPAIKRIMRENKNVTFYLTGLFGDLFDDSKDIIDRVHTVPFVKLKEYQRMLIEMQGDIAIAPLTDCNFNRAKSNLRLLEYASCKYAVVCSPVEPYKEFKNCVLFATETDEWYDQIMRLIKYKKLVDKLSVALYNRSKKLYNVKKNCKLLVNNLRSIATK